MPKTLFKLEYVGTEELAVQAKLAENMHLGCGFKK